MGAKLSPCGTRDTPISVTPTAKVRKEEGKDCNEGDDKAHKEEAHVQDCKSPVIDLNIYSSKPQDGQKIWTTAGGVTLYETDRYEIVLHALFILGGHALLLYNRLCV